MSPDSTLRLPCAATLLATCLMAGCATSPPTAPTTPTTIATTACVPSSRGLTALLQPKPQWDTNNGGGVSMKPITDATSGCPANHLGLRLERQIDPSRIDPDTARAELEAWRRQLEQAPADNSNGKGLGLVRLPDR